MTSFFKDNKLEKLKFITTNNFFLIAGPCVVENEHQPFEICQRINKICDKLEIPFIFKASYRKANRSSLKSFTGIGDEKALKIIKAVGKEFNVPVLTDVHSVEDIENAKNYVDVVQIPAFLCRQSDLLEAAAQTGLYVNVKKGQFLSAEAMKFVVEKIRACSNNKVMITERGTTFGYQDLIVDFRGVVALKQNLCPVILDITHSLQQPNQAGGVSGGRPSLIETIAKAGVATGFDGLFIETHPEPQKALSDGANMLKLDNLESLLEKLIKIKNAIN